MKNGDVDLFQKDCLEAHNEYRKKHGVAPLKLSQKICGVSQAWANRLAASGKGEHSTNQEYGENIFTAYSSAANYTVDGRAAVVSWYSEIKDHVFGTEPAGLGTGHFTQVVWKDSQELGIGCAKSRDGKIFVVANYFPPGNYVGDFAEKVPPVGGFGIQGKIHNVTDAMKHLFTKENFEEECLHAHNEYRKQHGVQPLKLNKTLCKEAKEWAKELAIKDKMEHAQNIPYGENVFSYWSSDPNHKIPGNVAVDKWYEEVSIHVFGTEPANLNSGHFTQVVWKGSKELGVGISKSSSGNIYVVARYSPPGNFVNKFKENVFPKGTTCEAVQASEAANSFNPTDFANDVVQIHNNYRRKHGVPPLKINWEICEFAKSWAENLAKEGQMKHRPDCPYGENIFTFWSSDPTIYPSAESACKKWYDEINEHDFTSEPSRVLKSGHFTQMMWKESTEMGVGLAKGKKDGKTYVVANYNPKGNYVGNFVKNVPKPL